MRLLTVVRRESPVTLAREVLWRTKKRWRQSRLPEKLERPACPVTYNPVGYYQLRVDQLGKSERDVILRYANTICSGQFPWFAYGSMTLGFPPCWNLDFVSGTTWPELPQKAIQVVRHDGSDVKVPWELSRLQFLPVLGKAWCLSDEIRYRQAGKDLLSNWIEKNPVGVGVNWTIAMEASLRAISICLFLELLAPSTKEEQSWMTRITESLWHHLLFIEAHNEFSHLSRGNHYLSNIVGLFCLSAFLQGPGMKPRRERYQRLIEREMLRQVYEDGGHFEASTGYHVLCLEMFTNALLLMRSLRLEPATAFTVRLQLMYRFLAALVDGRGRVPQLGDCDDGRVELLSDDLEQMLTTTPDACHPLTVSGLLGIGEYLFGESYGGRASDVPWYGQVSHFWKEQDGKLDGWRSIVFPDSGLAVARSGDLEVLFAAMPNAMGGKGSHTHNDKLSLIVRIGNEELFSDSGTGCYTRNERLRNSLRSTAAHNTVQVDGQEQNRLPMLPGGLFRSSDDARVSPIEVENGNSRLTLRAFHDGYRRLGVMHSRTLSLRTQASIDVEDSLTGLGNHLFQLFFHLQSEEQVAIEQAHGEEVICNILGKRLVKMRCQAPVRLELACLLTKVSNAYGIAREATTIIVSGNFCSSLKLSTQICWQN